MIMLLLDADKREIASILVEISNALTIHPGKSDYDTNDHKNEEPIIKYVSNYDFNQDNDYFHNTTAPVCYSFCRKVLCFTIR